MHHRLFSTTLAGAAAVLLLAATARADDDHGRRGVLLEFALIGDVPYDGGVPGQPYPPLDRVIREINADRKIRWVLHAGDIKSGSTRCSDELFLDRLARFNLFRKPFVFTPGDNEWTDCHRVNNGEYVPVERLARLRQLFFARPGKTIGGVRMTVDTQASRPGFEEFPENVRWTAHQVTFATLHVVGSQNGLAPFDPASRVTRTPEDDAEVQRRAAAARAWMDEAFARARTQRSAGVFLMIQANPGLEFIQAGLDRRGHEAFLAALEAHVITFGKPVVLAHGDSHFFRIDVPRLVTVPFLKNFTRVETFGAANVHWIRVTVDPRSPQVFHFTPEIIEEN